MLQYPGATQNKGEPLRARKNNEEYQEYEYDYQEEEYTGKDQHVEYGENQECVEEQLRAIPMMAMPMRSVVPVDRHPHVPKPVIPVTHIVPLRRGPIPRGLAMVGYNTFLPRVFRARPKH